MNNKLLLLSVCMCIAMQFAKAQQNMMVNQYMFAGVILNPAYAGTRSYQEVDMLYRKQWVGIKNAPVSNYVALHGPWQGGTSNVGTGVSLQHDNIGSSSQTEVSGMYAYRLKMGNEGVLSFGMRAGMLLFNSKLTEEVLIDKTDPVFNKNENNEPYVNFGAGAYYYTKNYYAGVSSQRLMSYGFESGFVGNADNSALANRVTYIYGGYVFEVAKDLKVKPNTLLKYSSNTPLGVDINALALYRDYFWLGASYKVNQGMAALFQLEILKPLRIGYAYDLRLSSNSLAGSFSSHEIMISYDFGQRRVVETDIKLF